MLASILALALASAPAAGDEALARYDARALEQLSETAPAAVADARAASEAYRAGRWQEAIAGYERVRAAAPRFSLATRRLCTARAELGERAAALALCRDAVALEATPVNQLALGRVLASQSSAFEATPAELREATALARAALAAGTADEWEAGLACEIALRARDLFLLGRCTDRLRAVAPAAPGTKAFETILALGRGELSEARARLAEARRAGLSPEAVASLTRAIDDAEPPLARWLVRAAWAFGIWSAILLLLLGTGVGLSAATLRAAARLAREPARVDSGAARLLRSVYAAVLSVTCAFYYASMPLLLGAVVGGGGAVLYGLFAVGHVPVKLALLVVVCVAVTLWAVAKGLWVSVFRPVGEDPGLRVPRDRHPALAQALRTVAARVRTRPVDAVFLTPGTDVAVFERGNLLTQLSGRSERCLVLGVGVLDGMSQGELKAVLAHEYGHFVNRDTAGGGLALAVRRSILQLARTLAEGGAAGWYNPAWWFVNGFYRVFLRVSQGASRLQEVLADRWAALAYGGRTFARGLEHVIARSVRFDAHAQRTLKEVVEGGHALANLYAYAPAEALDDAQLGAAVAEALAAEPSPYDSHPSPRDRIAWASAVVATAGASPDDAAPAWALFEDRAALEREMTDRVRVAVAARHGVEIPAEPHERPADADAPTGTD